MIFWAELFQRQEKNDKSQAVATILASIVSKVSMYLTINVLIAFWKIKDLSKWLFPTSILKYDLKIFLKNFASFLLWQSYWTIYGLSWKL